MNGPTKRHITVDKFHRSRPYKSPKDFGRRPVPIRQNRMAHGQALVSQVAQLHQDYATLEQSWEGREDVRAKGLIIELESAPEVELPTDRLLRAGLELLNERDERNAQKQRITKQTWFVPDGKLGPIVALFNDYLTKTRTREGKTQPANRAFAESIERIGKAATAQLWTERDEPFPEQSTLWLEIWLRGGADKEERKLILDQFLSLAEAVAIKVGDGRINLPEHTVVAAYGRAGALAQDLALLNCVAEIRKGRDYADFFENLPPKEQALWAEDLRRRTKRPPAEAPFVVLLDTGINRGHPLLDPLIPEQNNLTIKPAWSAADDDDHGTGMAGLCLYGDLTTVLSSSGAVEIPVNVEGVKIVPPPSERGTDERLAGYYTQQGVAVTEAAASERRRVWCLASTMKGLNDPRPTSWSSALDALASGTDNDAGLRRLFCLSSGNVNQNDWPRYPDSNYDLQVENPGQSWNVLCVGSFTGFDRIHPPNDIYTPLAKRGAMAPTNSSSLTWENVWPNKPDVVFEGGNAGYEKASQFTMQLPELMPLTISADFRKGEFRTTCGTSPATAFAARMASQIAGAYPEFWPETVRALIVHSASWTRAMSDACQLQGEKRSRFLLRTVGYGVPSLSKALECASGRVTMIAQSELQPFQQDGSAVTYKEMHLHALPWPTSSLLGSHAERVRMRVTLSYFIEPNPGNRGYTSTYRYPGCQLRFRVSSPGQSESDLEAQVCKIAADEMRQNEGRSYVPRSAKGWVIGRPSERGSVQSDLWEGSAADLVSMKHVVVFPLTGWWRTRPSRHRTDAIIRYSLIITLEAENPALDLYTEVTNQVAVPIGVQSL